MTEVQKMHQKQRNIIFVKMDLLWPQNKPSIPSFDSITSFKPNLINPHGYILQNLQNGIPA
jgi:hypothetical protein